MDRKIVCHLALDWSNDEHYKALKTLSISDLCHKLVVLL